MAIPNELKVVGGAPHGWGVWIDGVWHRVDVSEVLAAEEAEAERLRSLLTCREEAVKAVLSDTIQGYGI